MFKWKVACKLLGGRAVEENKQKIKESVREVLIGKELMKLISKLELKKSIYKDMKEKHK
jgi:hypothetical protein